MAKKNLLTDTKEFRFKSIALAGFLVSWNDALAERVAEHNYLKRDGAEQELMGSAAARFTMRLCFLGEKWADEYRKLVAEVRKDPRGLLVHPVLGEIQVVCLGITGDVNPSQALDTIEITISFAEDALDKNFSTDAQQTPATKASEADDSATAVTAAVGALAAVSTIAGPPVNASVSLAIEAKAAALTSAVTTYTAAALQASLAAAPDLTLDQRLADVATATDALLETLLDDDTRHDCNKYEALATAELVYSDCLELHDSIAALRPFIISYTVPSKTTLATVISTLYTSDAEQHAAEIGLLNRIPNPAAIPGGTVLRVVAP